MLRGVLTRGAIVAAAVASCMLHAMAAEPARTDGSDDRALDLKAPDIHRIFSPEEIDAILRRAGDPALEHIEVEALRLGDLPLEDNSASAAENIARTVAWLLMPSATFAALERGAPDATFSHRPPPFVQALHHQPGAARP